MIPLLLALTAWAGEVRLGVFVGNDEGAVGQEKLLFATHDARKMRDLFVAYGVAWHNALIKFWNDARAQIPAGYWTALIDDPRFAGAPAQRPVVQNAFGELGKRKAAEIGIAWIQASLEHRQRTEAARNLCLHPAQLPEQGGIGCERPTVYRGAVQPQPGG